VAAITFGLGDEALLLLFIDGGETDVERDVLDTDEDEGGPLSKLAVLLELAFELDPLLLLLLLLL
jgi:hypothetical protein